MTVALTGAGISTESGVPDFRSNEDSIFNNYGENIFSGPLFKKHPDVFYQFARDWFKKIDKTSPNDAHNTLSWLEKNNLLNCVITQNIDGLHIKSGNKNVYEIHGHTRSGHCIECNHQTDIEIIKKAVMSDKPGIPYCRLCGGVLKPDIVFFGDSMHIDLTAAMDAARSSDLILVLGSSMLIEPAASIPKLTQGKIVIINLEKTSIDHMADMIIRGKLAEIMRDLKENIKKVK